MIEAAIVDTNVAVVANARTPQASDACLQACVNALRNIVQDGGLFLDNRMLILREYQDQLGQPGSALPGDAFIKWAWKNQSNPLLVRQVAITPDPVLGFEEFPKDPRLSNFDTDDRKFAAVALASNASPPIINASDRDWWSHRTTLRDNGIVIRFLCPELMA